jgi:hypothetical protein
VTLVIEPVAQKLRDGEGVAETFGLFAQSGCNNDPVGERTNEQTNRYPCLDDAPAASAVTAGPN